MLMSCIVKITILAYNMFLFIDDSNYLQVVSCSVHEALCRRLETWMCQSFSPVKSHSVPPAHEVEGPPSLLSPKAEVGLYHFSRSEARGGATVQRWWCWFKVSVVVIILIVTIAGFMHAVFSSAYLRGIESQPNMIDFVIPSVLIFLWYGKGPNPKSGFAGSTTLLIHLTLPLAQEGEDLEICITMLTIWYLCTAIYSISSVIIL